VRQRYSDTLDEQHICQTLYRNSGSIARFLACDWVKWDFKDLCAPPDQVGPQRILRLPGAMFHLTSMENLEVFPSSTPTASTTYLFGLKNDLPLHFSAECSSHDLPDFIQILSTEIHTVHA
jgi:hypothetical protein